MKRCLFSAALLLWGLSPLVASPAVTAPPYVLGTDDKVRVIVSEWSSAGGEIRTRLTGEFTVDAAGQLSMPLIGEVQAAGQTLADLSRSVATLVQSRAGLINPPVASIEIVQYRPFYILGFVEKPGEYSYRPGLSLLQAVAIAGGVLRAPREALLRLERDSISAMGELRLEQERVDELLLRRAGLQAELENRETVELPERMTGRSAEAAAAKQGEVLKARREVLADAIHTQEGLRRLAQDETASMQSQLAALRQRLAVSTRESEELHSLQARGLATTAREFTVASSTAEVESRFWQVQTQIVRAGENILRADEALKTLRTNRRLELLAEMERTEASLDEARSRMRTAGRLLAEAEETAQRSGVASEQQGLDPAYMLIRHEQDQMKQLPASDATLVLPGDVIKVVPPPPRLQPLGPAQETGR